MRSLLLLTSYLSIAAVLQPVSPGRVDVLKAVNSLAPHVVGMFREPIGFKQTANGDYYVFDRRGHTVYAVDATRDTAKKLVG